MPLIATPNVDNVNRRQEKGKKLNYKLHKICMQKEILFVFANYLDNVLVWNYAIGRLKIRMEMVGMAFVPACFHVLNSLKLRLLPKNIPRDWRGVLRFLGAYSALLVNAMMIALFACWRLEQNYNEGAMLTTTDYGRRD